MIEQGQYCLTRDSVIAIVSRACFPILKPSRFSLFSHGCLRVTSIGGSGKDYSIGRRFLSN